MTHIPQNIEEPGSTYKLTHITHLDTRSGNTLLLEEISHSGLASHALLCIIWKSMGEIKVRLELLRKLMHEQTVPLAAYIIPTDDAHQVNYHYQLPTDLDCIFRVNILLNVTRGEHLLVDSLDLQVCTYSWMKKKTAQTHSHL